MTQYNMPDDIVDQIKELARRVETLERSPRLQNASIDKGSLTVMGGPGKTRVKMGLLEDGSYGINMYDGQGNPLSVSQLAFGLMGIANDATVTPALNAWTFDNALLQITTVTNHRLIVIVTASIVAGASGTGTPSDAWYGWGASVTDLNGVAIPGANIAADLSHALYAHYAANTGMDARTQASYVDVRTGIPNGAYTVTPAMYVASTGSPSNGATFANRRLALLPY